MEEGDRNSEAARTAVQELLHSSKVTVRCGELCVSVPLKMARRALKLARSLSACARKAEVGVRDEEKEVSDAERGGEREKEREKERRERRLTLPQLEKEGKREEKREERKEERIDDEADRACRNWTLEVSAASLEKVLDSMPKFKTAFVKQTTPDVPMLEADSVHKFIVHLSLSCSRSTFTQKSMKESAVLLRAEKRKRLSPAETHALIGEGYREFAGVAE